MNFKNFISVVMSIRYVLCRMFNLLLAKYACKLFKLQLTVYAAAAIEYSNNHLHVQAEIKIIPKYQKKL